MIRRNRDHFIKSKYPEFGGGRTPAIVVSLAGDNHHGPCLAVGLESGASKATTQHLANLMIGSGHSVDRVRGEQDDVSLLNGYPHLGCDAREDCISWSQLKSAGIDQGEDTATPLDFAVEAIPGRPRQVFDDRPTLSRQAVEERGLPHIRSPDNRDHRPGMGPGGKGQASEFHALG